MYLEHHSMLVSEQDGQNRHSEKVMRKQTLLLLYCKEGNQKCLKRH